MPMNDGAGTSMLQMGKLRHGLGQCIFQGPTASKRHGGFCPGGLRQNGELLHFLPDNTQGRRGWVFVLGAGSA